MQIKNKKMRKWQFAKNKNDLTTECEAVYCAYKY